MFDAIRDDPVVTVLGDFGHGGRVFHFLSAITHTLGSQANVLQAMGAVPPS